MEERSEGKEKTHLCRTIKGSISSEITRRAVAHHVIHPVRQTEIINTKGQKSRDWKDEMFLQITETWMEMEIINTNSEIEKRKKEKQRLSVADCHIVK